MLAYEKCLNAPLAGDKVRNNNDYDVKELLLKPVEESIKWDKKTIKPAKVANAIVHTSHCLSRIYLITLREKYVLLTKINFKIPDERSGSYIIKSILFRSLEQRTFATSFFAIDLNA